MTGEVLEMHPVTRITIDAIGPPGQRVFLLQASQQAETITLKIEKEQAQVLAHSIEQLLEELAERFPRPISKMEEPLASELMLREPIEPLFAVGQMGLGYDESEDALVLVAQELTLEEEAATARVARFWATRGQMQAISRHTLEVVAMGRPICPLCSRPIDPEGHFCPKSNGRERVH
ncbi:MAG: DUF3090 domain-containing protein [Anaerolineales bacterium]|nr:MAG: DUF3090 domain-containing protein [Anaerolineales bacterium]